MTEQLFKDVFDEQLAEGAIINDRMPGFREDYLLLHILLRKYKIKSCFEVGCNSGFGTKIIKNALGKDSKVISLDLPDYLAGASKQHPLSEGKKGVGYECDLPFTLVRGDSRDFKYNTYRCDAYYIDGEHTYDAVKKEAHDIAMLCCPELIIFHDSDMPEVYKGAIDGIVFRDDDYDLFRVTDTSILYAVLKPE